MMRAPWIAAGLVSLLSAVAQALPAAPFPLELPNADGTTVLGHLRGDEHLSWAEDLEGYPLAYDRFLGAWHYATLGVDGRLAPLPYRAGEVDPRRLGLARHLRPTAEAVRGALAARRLLQKPPLYKVPPVGAVPNLVFLVKFNCGANGSNCATVNRATTYTAASFGPVFNGATGSVKAYYQEVSYGSLQLTSTIADNAWIQLPNNDAYYASNDQANGNPHQMIRDAVAYLDQKYAAQGGFDFSPYDTDHDGVIDAVDVIHVGPGYESTGNPACIHSHYSNLMEQNEHFQSAKGTWFTAYHTEPELRTGGQITQIGAITHETAHFFGAPDLYDYNGASSGVGMWSLMAAGSWAGPGGDGTRPSHLEAWNKRAFNFLTATEITTSGTYTARPVETNKDVFLIRAGMPTTEYFLIENRQNTLFDTYLPGSGLAIYHVDETQSEVGYEWDPVNQTWKLTGWNNNPDRYLVDVEQADGRRDLNTNPWNQGDASDVWTNAAQVFGPSTNPNSRAYNATTSRITVRNVQVNATTRNITFDVALGSGLALGATCFGDSECQSGHCADGVCCDAACNLGPCDACNASGHCAFTTTACDDSNACTLNDACTQGVCKGTPKTCTSTNPCLVNPTCNPVSGTCEGGNHAPNGTPCDDANPNTGSDQCTSGVCKGTPLNPCLGKPDNTACDDGNKCTSGDACKSGVCTGAAVTCTPNACQTGGTCVPATGCTFTNKTNGTPCSDGDPCTLGDQCLYGTCYAGSSRLTCPAPDACHAAALCDSALGACPTTFPNQPNGTSCNDGNSCTGSDKCQAGVCVGTPATGTACPTDQCHEAGVCNASGTCSGANKPDGTACNDNDPATGGDQCLSGICKGTRLPCYGLAVGTPCDDGRKCTVNDACAAGNVCTGVARSCVPGPCQTGGACDSGSGACVFGSEPNGKSCDDLDPATVGDKCQAGACVGTPNPCYGKPDGTACDDGNPATSPDGCRSGVCTGTVNPCAGKPDGTACDDGNPATSPDLCKSGNCTGTVNACAGKPDGAACDDGNPATSPDGCKAGVCTGTANACYGKPDGSACDDGKPGTDGDKCTGGLCAGTVNACYGKADGTACDDANPLTAPDACKQGVCVGRLIVDPCAGKPDGTACDDANPGTDGDRCAAGVCTGTVNPCYRKADGTACDDGNAATYGDRCVSGACQGSADPCAALPDTTSCDDGDACTRDDFCEAGRCTGHNPKPCLWQHPCHAAGACESATGECSYPLLADGASCDDGDAATSGDQCLAGVCQGSATGVCSGKADGSACPGGTCKGGTCAQVTVVDDGCGCGASSGSSPAAFALLLFVLPLARRRRASPLSSKVAP